MEVSKDTKDAEIRDSSAVFVQELRSLGATIEESFGEHCTHLIWNNGKSKRYNAALAMEIHCVSPLWVEQCKQARKHVAESDFRAVASFNTSRHVTSIPEPVANQVNKMRSLESPSFSSSQKDSFSVSVKTSSNSKSAIPMKNPKQAKDSSTRFDNSTHQAVPGAIPLPKFKKTKLVESLLKKSNGRSGQSHRRSERISEIESDEDDDVDSESSGNTDESVEPKPAPKRLARGTIPANPSSSVSSTSVAVPDDMLDISCTPYDVDPKAIAVVRLDLLKSKKPAIPKFSENFKMGKRKHRVSVVDALSEDDESPVPKPAKKTATSGEIGRKHVAAANKKTADANEVPAEIGASAAIPLPALRIAVSRFNVANGDQESIVNTIKELIKSLEGWYANGSAARAAGQDTVSKILISESDDPDANCTHVVTSSSEKGRSLRILFALARGVPVVSEEWVYACLCASKWENPRPYRIPMYSHVPLGTPQQFLSGIAFHVVVCANPVPSVVESLVAILGAAITPSILNATCLLFGTSQDAQSWIRRMTESRDENDKACLTRAIKLSSKKRTVTFKFVCDCIEQCQLFTPTSNEHLINIHSTLPAVSPLPAAAEVSTSSSSKIFDAVLEAPHCDIERNTPSQSSQISDRVSTSHQTAEKKPLGSSAKQILMNSPARSPGVKGIKILADVVFKSPSEPVSTSPNASASKANSAKRSQPKARQSSRNVPQSDDHLPVREGRNVGDFYSLQCSDDEEWSEDDTYKKVKAAPVIVSASKSNKLRRLQ